jgi:hypothetical protein
MSDFTKLLRSADGLRCPTERELQAADRIEQLEAALRAIVDERDGCVSPGYKAMARATLAVSSTPRGCEHSWVRPDPASRVQRCVICLCSDYGDNPTSKSAPGRNPPQTSERLQSSDAAVPGADTCARMTDREEMLERAIRQVNRMQQLQRIRGNVFQDALLAIISNCEPGNEFDASIAKIANDAITEGRRFELIDPQNPLHGEQDK